MYHKYYNLVACLFLLGGTLSAKSYNDQDWFSRESPRRDHSNSDFYLEEELEGSGPDDEDGDTDDFFGSGSGGGAIIPERPTKGQPPKGFPDEVDTPRPVPETEEETNEINDEIDIEPPVGSQPPKNKIDPVPPKEENPPVNNQPNHGQNQGRQGLTNTQARVERSPIIAQPGILAGIIGGAVVGLLCAVLLVMFIVYRMRKKDEGSYALDEPKRSPSLTYTKARDREFFA